MHEKVLYFIINRKIQIKVSINPPEWLNIKKKKNTKIPNVDKDVQKLEVSHTDGGV